MYDSLTNEQKLNKRRSRLIFLIVSTAIIAFSGFSNQGLLYVLSTLIFSCVGMMLDPILPLCIGVATASLALQTNAIVAICLKCLMTFPAFLTYVTTDSRTIKTKELMFFFSACLILVLSATLGQDANCVTAFLQLLTLMCYQATTNVHRKGTNVFVSTAFVLAGVYIAIAVLFQISMDSAVTLFGTRLTYNGSVRTLSTSLAFPIFMIFSKLLVPGKQKLNVRKVVFLSISLVALIWLLISTYSRGVLISLVVAVACLLVPQFCRFRLRQIVVYMVLFAVAIYLIFNMQIDMDMMLAGLSDGSGRTDIWRFFFGRLEARGVVGYLIGFGPGDILRVSAGSVFDGSYSHSSFLDYFFSYGLLGFCLLAYMLIRALTVAIKSKNATCVGMFVLAVSLYSTHGNSASVPFHILLALTYSLSVESIGNNKTKL